MGRRFWVVLIGLLWFPVVGFTAGKHGREARRSESRQRTYPKIFFQYGLLDRFNCPYDPDKESHPVPAAMAREAEALAPKLAKVWQKEGEPLLASVVKTVGKPFTRREQDATLVACPSINPMSSPLIINVRDMLKSATPKGKKPWPLSAGVDQVFHELLHNYLIQIVPEDFFEKSPLIAHYRSKMLKEGVKDEEVEVVLEHLHLNAIQKVVLTGLGMKQRLAETIKFDSAIPIPGYKRSWEILNTPVDGKTPEEALLAELKK